MVKYRRISKETLLRFTENNLQSRSDVAKTFLPCVRNGKVIFIDESGFQLTHRRNHAFAYRPQDQVNKSDSYGFNIRVLEWNTSKFSKAIAILWIFWLFSESYSNDCLILEENCILVVWTMFVFIESKRWRMQFRMQGMKLCFCLHIHHFSTLLKICSINGKVLSTKHWWMGAWYASEKSNLRIIVPLMLNMSIKTVWLRRNFNFTL